MFSGWETPTTRRNGLRYFAEVAFGVLLCFVFSRIAKAYVAALPDGLTRDAVALLPMIGVLVIGAAILRAIRRTDEYGQRKLLANLAATGGLTMVWSIGYAMLEHAGWPRLSMSSVWVAASIAWLLCSVVEVLQNLAAARRR
ncbi:hypothetical protein [Roseiterribacter gracilis]|uniref:Transmembrane protein n=1 Tax=Roseiterribacter gracilis TaxID=2812848 RepID=A0A8S8XEY5_9PROT|nr:hypothetical protein TMPK1_27260 [Rhodospirillales bacterium TMPK1]